MSNSAFKVENGLIAVGGAGVQSNFYHELNVNGANLVVNGGFVLVNGNFYVSGNLVYANTSVANAGLIPATDQVPLGNSQFRFDGFFYDVQIYDTITFVGSAFVNSSVIVNGSINAVGNVTVGGTLATNSLAVNTAQANSVALTHASFYSNVGQTNSTTQTIVDAFATSIGNCFKYICFVSDSAKANIQSIELLGVTDGNNVLLTKYGDVYNTELGVFDASVVSNTLQLYFTAIDNNVYTIRTLRTIVSP
jgi:hypothetical protein